MATKITKHTLTTLLSGRVLKEIDTHQISLTGQILGSSGELTFIFEDGTTLRLVGDYDIAELDVMFPHRAKVHITPDSGDNVEYEHTATKID